MSITFFLCIAIFPMREAFFNMVQHFCLLGMLVPLCLIYTGTFFLTSSCLKMTRSSLILCRVQT